jgi:KaiC/GvpD/RAD55 family RecA-like ATPase
MEEDESYIKTIIQSIEDVRKEGIPPFLWGGIKEGSFGYIFGPSKCGKTIFCENIAMMFVSGAKEFLGFPILEKSHRVLIISLEEYERPRCERNGKQVDFLKAKPELISNLLVIKDEFPKFLKSDQERQILSETIAESKAGIVIIDSLTRMSYGDIEKSDNARDISFKLKEIANDNAITMMVIHHTPKLNGRMLTIDSLAGSHVFAQEADFIIGINKVGGVRYIKEVACRYKREDDEKVLTFEINDNLWIVPGLQVLESTLFRETDGRANDLNLEAVRTLIKNTTEIKGSSNFKSGEILREAENKMDRSTFFEKLVELRSSGEISQTGKGAYKFNFPPSET